MQGGSSRLGLCFPPHAQKEPFFQSASHCGLDDNDDKDDIVDCCGARWCQARASTAPKPQPGDHLPPAVQRAAGGVWGPARGRRSCRSRSWPGAGIGKGLRHGPPPAGRPLRAGGTDLAPKPPQPELSHERKLSRCLSVPSPGSWRTRERTERPVHPRRLTRLSLLTPGAPLRRPLMPAPSLPTGRRDRDTSGKKPAAGTSVPPRLSRCRPSLLPGPVPPHPVIGRSFQAPRCAVCRADW